MAATTTGTLILLLALTTPAWAVPVTLSPPATLTPPVTMAPVQTWADDPPPPDPVPLVLDTPVAAVTWVADDPPVEATPEPVTLLLYGTAMVGVGWAARRWRT